MIDKIQSIATPPCNTHNTAPDLLLHRWTDFLVGKFINAGVHVGDCGTGPGLCIGNRESLVNRGGGTKARNCFQGVGNFINGVLELFDAVFEDGGVALADVLALG